MICPHGGIDDVKISVGVGVVVSAVIIRVGQPIKGPIIPLLLGMLILLENDCSVIGDSNEKSVPLFIGRILGDLTRSVIIYLHIRISFKKLGHIVGLAVQIFIRIKGNVSLVVIRLYEYTFTIYNLLYIILRQREINVSVLEAAYSASIIGAVLILDYVQCISVCGKDLGTNSVFSAFLFSVGDVRDTKSEFVGINSAGIDHLCSISNMGIDGNRSDCGSLL